MAAKKKSAKTPAQKRPRRARKTTAKTTAEIPKAEQPHGGALNAGGTPGNKGGTGRPPNWLKDWCDELLAKPENKTQVENVLGNADHAAYHQMWKAVADRAHGKPAQSVTVAGSIELIDRAAALKKARARAADR